MLETTTGSPTLGLGGCSRLVLGLGVFRVGVRDWIGLIWILGLLECLGLSRESWLWCDRLMYFKSKASFPLSRKIRRVNAREPGNGVRQGFQVHYGGCQGQASNRVFAVRFRRCRFRPVAHQN